MVMLRSLEQVAPTRHPIRQVVKIADAVLAKLSPTLDARYSAIGGPSIPRERLLEATVLMARFTVRKRAAVLRAA